ncbi:hypothetical protein J9303_04150 [Bacillaceae bacterium Marseille-Q3522]|nr:hypothetical protein [Bacillaceae bacterium Marseille-Q3522]
MANKISVHPDQLDGLANRFVNEINAMEGLTQDLHLELGSMIINCDYRFRHCFNGVGDAWGAGKNLTSQLNDNEIYIRNTGDKFAWHDNLISKLYKLHQEYGNITALGSLTMAQITYYGLGFTKFTKDANGFFSFKHTDILDDAAKAVDKSKYSKTARIFLDPFSLRKKNLDKSFSDIIHKQVTRYYPQYVTDFTNAVRGKLFGLTNNKITFGDAIRLGKGFARSNALSTFIVTTGSEIIGAGLKISENYSKYGNNREVLKRENAKAVGNAVNNTVAITAGSVVGGVIGGAIGSFAGPVGTVVIGSLGSFVGGYIGEKAASLTAGIAEKAALLFQDQIQAGIDSIGKLYESAAIGITAINKGTDIVKKEINKGIDKVKDTASSLIEGAKDFFNGKLSFG